MENFEIQSMLNTVATKFKGLQGHYSVVIYIKSREEPVHVSFLSFLSGVNESQSTEILRLVARGNRDQHYFIPVNNIDYVRVYKEE